MDQEISNDARSSKSPHRSHSQSKSLASGDGISRRTHFTLDEIRWIQLMYRDLTQRGQTKMDRLHFREWMYSTFDITDDLMLDRVFRAFDANNDAIVEEPEFILTLSTFLRGTLEEQINFAYFCYDINGDRSLARDELYHCLKNCLLRTPGTEEDVEESIKDIVEIAMRKLDTDKNGQITFPDFQAAVINDPLLLEACGSCIPSSKAVASFFLSLKNKYGEPEGSKERRKRQEDNKRENRKRERDRRSRRSTSSIISRNSIS